MSGVFSTSSRGPSAPAAASESESESFFEGHHPPPPPLVDAPPVFFESPSPPLARGAASEATATASNPSVFSSLPFASSASALASLNDSRLATTSSTADAFFASSFTLGGDGGAARVFDSGSASASASASARVVFFPSFRAARVVRSAFSISAAIASRSARSFSFARRRSARVALNHAPSTPPPRVAFCAAASFSSAPSAYARNFSLDAVNSSRAAAISPFSLSIASLAARTSATFSTAFTSARSAWSCLNTSDVHVYDRINASAICALAPARHRRSVLFSVLPRRVGGDAAAAAAEIIAEITAGESPFRALLLLLLMLMLLALLEPTRGSPSPFAHRSSSDDSSSPASSSNNPRIPPTTPAPAPVAPLPRAPFPPPIAPMTPLGDVTVRYASAGNTNAIANEHVLPVSPNANSTLGT